MKVIVVKSHKSSHWISCNAISSNLQRLYLELEKTQKIQTIWFNVDEIFNSSDLPSNNIVIMDLINVIEREKPDKLVFIDHLPGPYLVLYQLSLIMEKAKIPPLVIHVYGDFTYFAKEWHSLNEYANGHDITFIVASHAQKRLITNFLNASDTAEEEVEQLCFPVNTSEFYYNNEERENCRNELGLNENDFVIIYTGRISTQKNVDLLIKEFGKIDFSNETTKFHLWVVGEFDDHGVPLLGLDSATGVMFNTIQDILNKLPAPIRENITLWGHKTKEEMLLLLNAADMFTSFSLYHDEDFGMSPAEALSTGIPACLTHWGGYYSFAPENHEWECELVPVELNDLGFNIKIYKFHEHLKHLVVNREKLHKERSKRSILFLEKFGIEGNVFKLSAILKSPLKKPFSGFNWLLNLYWKNRTHVKRNHKINEDFNPQTKNYYYQIYKNYLKAT